MRDVNLIGEIRDTKKAIYAFRAALTGHLVLTTIHANNGKGTLERLKDIGISELDIKQTVKSIICLDLILIKKFKERQRRADRKSTRLNSSHVSISYAVFCL